MASIELEQLSKRFPDGFEAVKSVDLEIHDGERMVFVGPSGCGKTTILRMIAGLEEVTSGSIRIDGRIVNDVPAKNRDIAMVFQNYALYPHMTVSRNIGFALKLRKTAPAEIERRVGETAEILGLQDYLSRRPAQLSGGQRQRVAMGRAIVREPSIFLMDEPLSNLDSKLRVQMRSEISRIQRMLGVTTVYVTHDQTEAMTLGDRVAVLKGGVIQQCETPQVLYNRPANLFVAAFIGSPSMNLYEATVARGALRLGSQTLCDSEELARHHPPVAAYEGRTVIVGVRPEHLEPATADAHALSGHVHLVEALGSEILVHFTIDARRVEPEEALDDEARGLAAGTLEIAGAGIARVDPGATVRVDDPIYFSVQPRHLRFFDPVTGAAVEANLES